VGGVDKKTGEQLSISTDLSTRLQTEMAKLKRFTIYSAHNRAGVTFFEALADVDDTAKLREPTETRDIDLVLSGRVTVTKERQDRHNDTLLIYEVECDFSCEDLKTHTVKFAEKAKGRTVRKQILSFSGQKMAGYSDADESQAITQAAMKALAVVANKLGNTYPVGGKITGISSSGDRMQLAAGFEDGIGNKQQCVIFVNDGGVDVPLALAEAAPGEKGSNLSLYKWNRSDGDAEPLIEALKKSPRTFLNENKLYAVGYGLSVPPEWENAYEGSMDEQRRLK
ncbi:MAG: hypothetical protein RSB14_07155, partial [Kiritimatiellia bacterium]